MINIIVATGKLIEDKGRPIGKDGKMPWKSSSDMKWFREMTIGHPVIMGRKTYESIGKPLEERTNIVVSRSMDQKSAPDGVICCKSVLEALALAEKSDEQVFVIGGAEVYKQVMDNDLADRIYLTEIDADVPDADAFFPEPDQYRWWRDTLVPLEADDDGKKPMVLRYIRQRESIQTSADFRYFNLLADIMQNGEVKDTRSGQVKSVFARLLRFDLLDGLPMLNTKKMFSKGVIHELLWFISGETNIKYLVENGVHIWDDDAYRHFKDVAREFGNNKALSMSKERFITGVMNGEIIKEGRKKYVFGDLGPVYGHQWAHWGKKHQLKSVVETLKSNPNDRRMIVSSWNVAELDSMALPPCHYSCMFTTSTMSRRDRYKWMKANKDTRNMFASEDRFPEEDECDDIFFDSIGVPTMKVNCMWNQRSVDCGLGLPFNILSYAILTNMVAHCAGMAPGELVFSGTDCHIYLNQMEGLKEQMYRDPFVYSMPKLNLNRKVKDITKFKFDDIVIEGYKSYGKIELPLSVGLKEDKTDNEQ